MSWSSDRSLKKIALENLKQLLVYFLVLDFDYFL